MFNLFFIILSDRLVFLFLCLHILFYSLFIDVRKTCFYYWEPGKPEVIKTAAPEKAKKKLPAKPKKTTFYFWPEGILKMLPLREIFPALRAGNPEICQNPQKSPRPSSSRIMAADQN